MENEREFRQSLLVRTFMWLIGIGFAILSCWQFTHEPFSTYLMIVGGGGVLFSFLLISSARKYLIRITDKSIIKEYFLRRTMDFTDIIRADIYQGYLVLFTKDRQMKVSSSHENQHLLMEIILHRLNNKEGVEFRGEDRELELFGLK